MATSGLKNARLFLKTLLFSIVVPGAVTVLIPGMLTGWFQADARSLINFLGIAPFTLGWAVYAWCAFSFVNNGHGTPAPIDPPQALVISGLYKIVRNPMYIGMWLILLGESIFFDSRSLVYYAGGFAVFVFIFVLGFEEPRLRRRFGQDYGRYCQSTPRWLPFLKPSQKKQQTSV